jgi:hypothetical protein
MDSQNDYDVPEEVADLMDKALASEDLRNCYVKLPFGFRKARKCAKDVYYFKRKFWAEIRQLYPELSKMNLSYNGHDAKIIIVK